MFDTTKPISWQIILLTIILILILVAIGIKFVNQQTQKRKAK